MRPKIAVLLVVLSIISGFFNFIPANQATAAAGASLYLSPALGTFVTGGTFTTSIVLNTNGQFINAVDIGISYPPDKLQIVSPSLGTSIISIWTSQPHFDNQKGTITFRGGIPNPGIRTDRGVVATITFRVKSVGQAIVRFSPDSKVLLNDGLATDILTDIGSGIYDLVLPPPRGPIIVSESHPDQARWYPNKTLALRWTNSESVDGFSYVLSQEAIDIPDDISEGRDRSSVVYRSVGDGTHFFHVKALRNGVWGETSHFAVNIDATPPAEFPIEISPSARTSNHRPLINFFTTDALSGLDHYEMKIVPRNATPATAPATGQTFFVEATSPASPELALGRYDVIIRAFDKAGNIREITQSLSIVTPFLQLIGFTLLPRWLTALLGIILLLILLYIAYRVWRWHHKIHQEHLAGALNDPEIARKLKELQDKQAGYLKSFLILFVIGFSLLVGAPTFAAETIESPPIVTTVSENITNEELFYIGGKVSVPGSEITVYLQSTHDGEAISATVKADQKGDWFYSHPEFLQSGRYLVWTQKRIDGGLSAPSAQYEIDVAQTAIQFGVSRVSLETLYLVFVMVLFTGLGFSVGFIIYHAYHGNRKNRKLRREIFEAEEAVKRGFLLLRKDILAEVASLQKMKNGGKWTPEDEEKEKQLLRDLEWATQYIEKEVRDIERIMGL